MAPDTPEREPEMQDTPPCRCPTKWRCLVRLRFFCVRFGHRVTDGGIFVPFCSPRRRATDGGAFGLLQAVWEPPVSIAYNAASGNVEKASL